MTVLFVQKSVTWAKFQGTNASAPTLPAGATANNLIVIPWSHNQFDGHSVAMAATGYTVANVINQASNIASTGLLYKVAVGAEASAALASTSTGTAGNSFGQDGMAEFSGLASVSPFISADSATNTGANTLPTVSSGNPLSQASGLAIATFCGGTALTGATTPPPGWTNLFSDLTNGECPSVHSYLIYSSTAQLTAALGTLSGSDQWAATVNIFKAATGGGAVTPRTLLLGCG